MVREQGFWPMQIVSFDIETSDVFELKPGESLEKYAPFHVAVAAVVHSSGAASTWLSLGPSGVPMKNMRRETALELLGELRRIQVEGQMLCAWNGAGFDLQWLGFAAQDQRLPSQIALDLFDPMFQFFNLTGYPVGLDAVAKGMGLPETKMLGSEDAPRLWCEGRHDEAIEYVSSDARITNAIVERICPTGEISWFTRRGTHRTERLGSLKRVREVLLDPEPDQSWMEDPLPRSKFVGWISKLNAPLNEFTKHEEFRMVIEDVFEIKGRGPVAIGRIKSGSIRNGDQVVIEIDVPGSEAAVVVSIEMFNRVLTAAHVGDNVGLVLAGIEKTRLRRGMVIRRFN